jgi:hypothetical protein
MTVKIRSGFRACSLFMGCLWFLCTGSAPAQVVISEFQALNATTVTDPDYLEHSDWVELFNPGTDVLDLTDYSLSDELDHTGLWQIPAGTLLPSGAYLLIWADGRNNGYHASFRLGGSGEQIGLYGPDGDLVDSVSFGRQLEDHSSGRLLSTGSWVLFTEPTPGSPNPGFGYTGISSSPRFSPDGGFYPSAPELDLILPGEEGTVRYTLDGSEPDSTSPEWTGPLQMGGTTIVRARAYEESKLPGDIVTRSYFVGEADHDLPVVSISTDPSNLWNPDSGIYVNYQEDWERPCSFELYNGADGPVVAVNAGLKIFGGTSRARAQKSFSIHARDRYGTDRIRYRLLPGREISEYGSIVLRNSANDWSGDWRGTMFRDALIHTLVEGQMDLDYQSYQPVAVYLNGAYWGILNIRDKHNEDYCGILYGVNADSVDIIKHNEVVSGNGTHYNEMMDFFENHNLSDNESYSKASALIDAGELINYLITEIYSCNIDWPANNHRLWSSRGGGLGWRWMLFDTEFGFNGFQWAPASTNMFNKVLDPDIDDYVNKGEKAPWATRVFIKMFQNESFRNSFISHYISHRATTYDPGRVVGIVDSLEAMLETEMPRHIARWSADGGIYSMDVWRENIQGMRDFAHDRPPFALANLMQTFHIPASEKVNFELSSEEGGMLYLDGIRLKGKEFSASYFLGNPVSLSVVPDSGYYFAGWEVDGAAYMEKQFIARGDEWKYLDDGSDQGTGWIYPGFQDQDWTSGKARFGYGTGNETTVVNYGPDPGNKYITTYFRKSFQVEDPDGISRLVLRLLRDDGAVVYLNGTVAVRSNMTSRDVVPATLALQDVSGVDEDTYYEFNLDPGLLVQGENLLAAEVHQSAAESSDLGFDLELSGSGMNPGSSLVIETRDLDLVLEGNTRVNALLEKTGEPGSLRINEILAGNPGTFLDEYGQADDWIELYNSGDLAIDLAGLYFTDTLGIPGKWQIPAGDPLLTTVDGMGYVVLWADGEPAQGPLHLDFKLSREGEEIGIFRRNGDSFTLIDSLRYGPLGTGISLARVPDGTGPWQAFVTQTPGSPNFISGVPARVTDQDGIVIFPNPARALIRIRTTGGRMLSGEDYQQVRVFASTGQLVYSREFGPGEEIALDLNVLEPGIYWIRADSKDSFRTGQVVLVQ